MSIATSFLHKVSFFQSHPEVVAAGTYHLRCSASHGVVDDFVAKIYDSSARVTLTRENVGELRELCSELGFHGFDEDLRVFEIARAQVGADEMLESIEQSVAHHEAALEALHQKVKQLTVKLEGLIRNGVATGSASLSGVFPYLEEWPFNGIIAHLTRECGGNVHDKGIIEVTASSIADSKYPAKNAADLSVNNWFISGDEENSWLCYDFKEFRVRVNGASVRSFGYGPGAAHPNYLTLEGSLDGKEWNSIAGVSELNGRYVTRSTTFGDCGPFRFVRLIQKAKNSCENNILALSAFEIFGTLTDCRVTTVAPSPPEVEEGVEVTTGPDGREVATCNYEPWRPVHGIFAYLGCMRCNYGISVSFSSTDSSYRDEWNNPCSSCRNWKQPGSSELCQSCRKRRDDWDKERSSWQERIRCGGAFSSRDEPTPWVCYDFGQRLVALIGYNFCTSSPSGALLLSGSHDGTVWHDLDVWENVKNGYHQCSSAMSEPMRFIRLLRPQAGKVAFDRIEFFGSLYEPKKKEMKP